MKLRVIQGHRVNRERGYEERIAGSVVEIEGDYDPNLYEPVENEHEDEVQGLQGSRVQGSENAP